MSILRFLLLMLLSIITLVSFTAALTGYRASVSQAGALFDRNLANFARALRAFSQPDASIEPLVLDDMAFQIWRDGALQARSHDAPFETIETAITGFSETNFSGQRWRTYSWYQQEDRRRIIVAQPLARRIELAEAMALASLSPLVIAVPLLAILIALTISRGLSPLEKLAALLRRREANDLTPVKVSNSPDELRPVVDTINRLLRKLDTAFAREKRFSADAAHELRTPISVLQVGIHNLAEQHPELQPQLDNLQSGVERMSHVVEQILHLNRTHPDYFKANLQVLSLRELCQQSIAQCYNDIDARQQNIALEGCPVSVYGDSFALLIMLNNLILNASKYSPRQGHILVTTDSNEGMASVTIEDSGPGIPEAEYRRVMDRFYRSGGDQHTSDIAGCGLGMAIVQQVVDLHDAEIALGCSPGLGGLSVSVIFPAVPAGAL